MKVVLDTNVLFVSVSEFSPYYPIYRALKNREYELVVTTDVMLEYHEVIGDEMSQDVADDLIAFLSHASNVHKISKYYYWRLITADPDDDKFVDAAVAGNVDFIVSDDRHFRVLKKIVFPKVKVISTDEFLKMVENF